MCICLFVFDAINGILKILISSCSLPDIKNVVDFCILALCPMTLLHFRNIFIDSMGFFYIDNHVVLFLVF